MSALKKVIESTSRDIEHVTQVIYYKRRTTYVLECGHTTTRTTERGGSPSKRLKCTTCAEAGTS